MINPIAMEYGNTLSDNLNLTGVNIQPLSGSVISELVNSLSAFNMNGSDDLISVSSSNGTTTAGDHSSIENVHVINASKIISNIMRVSKNTINPVARLLLSRIESERKIQLLSNSKLLGNIIPVSLDPVYTDTMFQSLIKDYVGVFKETRTNKFRFILKRIFTELFTNEDELRELILIGSKTLDEKINACLTTSLKALTDVFITVDDLDFEKLTMEQILIVFLITVNILQVKNDKCRILVDNQESNLEVIGLKVAFASTLNFNIGVVTNELSLGKMVANNGILSNRNCCDDPNILTLSPTLYVYNDAYRTWITKQGGSPEAAMGFLAMVNSDKNFSITIDSELINNPAKFKAIYDQKLQVVKSSSMLAEGGLVRRIITDELTTYIIDNIDEVPDKTLYHGRLRTALEREYYGQNETSSYVIKVVCATLTDGDDVKNFLLSIDGILKEGETDLNTAVFLATVQLIAKWIVMQYKITK